jgi:hypothetical protein
MRARHLPVPQALALVCSLTAAACSSAGGPREVPLDGDATSYAEEVQPVVARYCAFLGCHGREGMPLTLYAVDYLRLRDPQGLIDFARPPLDERALAPAELEHNRQALAERAGPNDPGGSLLVRRLIPETEGGTPHAGVVVFAREADPDLSTLRRFLDTVHAR